MEYPIIDLFLNAYFANGWTGLDIPLSIRINSIQKGSGTPTPLNIRPIDKGTTVLINGESIDIYGATLDINNKQLIIDSIYKTYDGTENWQPGPTSSARAWSVKINEPDMLLSNTSIIKSNYLEPIPADVTWGQYDIFISNTAIAPDIVCGYKTVAESVSNWKNYLSNHTLQVVYKLSNNTVYNLSDSDFNGVLESIGYGISHRFRLPMIRCFPIINSLTNANNGTITQEDADILNHYLSKMGIGNIVPRRGMLLNSSKRDKTTIEIVKIKEDIPIEDFQIEEKKTGEEDLNVKTE